MRKLKEITVEVTQKCNSNCIFCSSLSNTCSDNELPLLKLKEISKFCNQKKAENINISGGEPLLYEKLPEYIKFNESIGLKSTIYSSGNVFNYKVFENIIALNPKNLKIIFNYPSSNENIFKKLVNSNKFSPKNLDKCIDRIDKQKITIETHIVPNALNIDSLFDTISHLKNIGIKKVSLLRLVIQGRAVKNKNLLELNEFTKLIKIINRVKNQLCDTDFQLRTGIPFNTILNKPFECFAGFSKLIFRFDGFVFPCEAFKEAPYNTEFILGNIYKNSLLDIWNNRLVHNRLISLSKEAKNNNESCPAQMLYRKKLCLT